MVERCRRPLYQRGNENPRYNFRNRHPNRIDKGENVMNEGKIGEK
jgi:hypothetical protein